MMKSHNITSLKAMKIYNSAICTINHISIVCNHFKNKNANNFVTLMVNMIKPRQFNEQKKV